MKMRSSLPGCVLFIVSAAVSLASPREIWVAPTGSDQNPGSREQPLASPAAALRKARELRRTNDPAVADGIDILLRGGVYSLFEPLFVRPEDSGTAKSPTTFRGAEAETPILSGGVIAAGWKPLGAADEREYPALPAAALKQVWISDAPTFGGRPIETRQLWVAGVKAVRAREPNVGAMHRLRSWDRSQETAGIASDALNGLRSPANAEMIVQQQWSIAILRLRSIELQGDTAELRFHQPESRVEFEHPWPQPILPPEGAGAFFLTNAVEFLDEPGEWFQDPVTSRILYWPRTGEDPGKLQVIVPSLEQLVVIEGTLDHPVSHLRFERLEFQHTTWLRPSQQGHVPLQAGLYVIDAYKLQPPGTADWAKLENQAWVGRPPAAFSASGTSALQIRNCSFRHIASGALDLIRATNGTHVDNCEFRDIGGNAILAGAFNEGPLEVHHPYDPSDVREICSDERLTNNLVSDAANEDWSCVGIGVGFARGVTIEHNEITDVSYTGISVGWGWTRTLNVARNHRIHGNLIHHIATRLCDTAGIYTLSAQPGTTITENVIHSITMSPQVDRPDHWFYLYLDEGSSFIRVADNWCPEERFLKNANGPGNVWENNGPQVSAEIKGRAGRQKR